MPFRFRFREDLPQGAIRNPNYPEHRLVFIFLNSLAKGPNDYTGPSQFQAVLGAFPAFIDLAKELGYKMDSHRERPHVLGVRTGGRGGKHIVGCGSLEYGVLERYQPEIDDIA